jgi:limonene-1,2-epoxide hydrolase
MELMLPEMFYDDEKVTCKDCAFYGHVSGECSDCIGMRNFERPRADSGEGENPDSTDLDGMGAVIAATRADLDALRKDVEAATTRVKGHPVPRIDGMEARIAMNEARSRENRKSMDILCADLDALADRVERLESGASHVPHQVKRITALERAHDKLIVRVEQLESWNKPPGECGVTDCHLHRCTECARYEGNPRSLPPVCRECVTFGKPCRFVQKDAS